MNTRRTPFQFTSIDPAKRQAELQKRFGLPTNEMILDYMNPSTLGARSQDSCSASGSPRLRHRSPTFHQGVDEKFQSINNNDGHKPKVRVIPIQVEGVDEPVTRHRTFSRPASTINGTELKRNAKESEDRSFLKGSNFSGVFPKPKVCNIPVKIEKRESVEDITAKKSKSDIQQKKETKEQVRELKVEKVNGCAASCEKRQEPVETIPLKQIENVLNKLQTYHEEVEKFTGSAKDKQYRYLDEMLTRCMLDLDNIDTLGLDVVRQSRKAAVKKVQASIDLLEEKIHMSVDQDSKIMVNDTNVVHSDIEMGDVTEDSKIEQDTAEDAEMKEDSVNVSAEASVISNTLEKSTEDTEMDDETISSTNVESADQKEELGSMEVVESETQRLSEDLSSQNEPNVSIDPIHNSDHSKELKIVSSATPSIKNSETDFVSMNNMSEEVKCYEEKSLDQDSSPEELVQSETFNHTVHAHNSGTGVECENVQSDETNDEQKEKEVKSEIIIQELESSANEDELVMQPIVTEPSDATEHIVNKKTDMDLPLIKESNLEDQDVEISELET